jgi:tetratricopeptide (TPR) repeat protein
MSIVKYEVFRKTAETFGTQGAYKYLAMLANDLHRTIFGLLPHGTEAVMTTEAAESKPAMNPQLVVRRLAAAEGYLELGLPNYALAELKSVPDPGPFAPIAELFRGEALQAQEKYADAIEPLNRAAQMFPAPFNQRALLALSNCYRQDGQIQLADETAAAVEMPPDVPVGTKLIIAPIFHFTKSAGGRISGGNN